MGFVSKLSMLFFLIVIYTMASYYIGMFIAPKWHRHRHPDNLTGLKWSTFKGNWNSGYEKGVSFPVALAIFFPCYTGILRLGILPIHMILSEAFRTEIFPTLIAIAAIFRIVGCSCTVKLMTLNGNSLDFCLQRCRPGQEFGSPRAVNTKRNDWGYYNQLGYVPVIYGVMGSCWNS